MRKALLIILLLSGALSGGASVATAQPVASSAYWFEVRQGVLVLQSAAGSKPVTKPVTLPNGTRLDYQTTSAVLADGSRQELREGDAVSLNGVITIATSNKTPDPAPARAAPTPEMTAAASLAPAAPPAPASVPTAGPVASAPAAPAPATPAPAAATPTARAVPAATPAFAYSAPVPVNGKLKGVVELGASGFNSFIVRLDAQKRWQLVKSEFGNSLVMENMATDLDVRQGLKAYIGKMLDFGVTSRDIHFVVSSGAQRAEVTARIIRTLKSLGYVVNTVTPEREGGLGLRAVLPATYHNKAFVVDLGSANTKVSWLTAKGQPAAFETYGAKYYETGATDQAVATAVKAKFQQVPAGLRQTCFIIGGVPFELAKKVRQGKERYTVLRSADYYGQPEGAKAKSGLVIYRALAEATGCQQFVFDWDANFTIGYLLSLP